MKVADRRREGANAEGGGVEDETNGEQAGNSVVRVTAKQGITRTGS